MNLKSGSPCKSMNKELFFRALAKFFAGLLLVAALLFLPAWTFHYPQAWLFLGILFIPMFGAGLILNTPVIAVYRFGLYGFAYFLGYFVFSHDEIIDKMILLDDYMRIIPKMRDKLADHKVLVKKLMYICGYNQETGELNSSDIPFRKLDCVITLINDAITRDSREEYRALLYALLNTRERSAVASLMKDIWSGEE